MYIYIYIYMNGSGIRRPKLEILRLEIVRTDRTRFGPPSRFASAECALTGPGSRTEEAGPCFHRARDFGQQRCHSAPRFAWVSLTCPKTFRRFVLTNGLRSCMLNSFTLCTMTCRFSSNASVSE